MPAACAALAGMLIGGAQVTSTTLIPAAGDDPEFCQLDGRIDPALNFELRLPASWNGKAVFLGGGGYDGTIPSPDGFGPSPGILRAGYVTIATDSGHRGSAFDGVWALNDHDALDNFADQAWHRVLAAARQIVLARYALPIQRTYFEGGSSGGREALIQAQRWPDDYDGVIAREPALSFTALLLAANRIAQQMFGTPGGFLPPSAVHIFSQAVLDACDGLDGLADGIVSNVAACHVDTAALLCPGAGVDCLTQAQIDTVNTILSELSLDFPLAHGVMTHPGYPLSGAEESQTGWLLWQTGFSARVPAALLFTLQDQFIKYFVTQDAGYDSLTFSPAAAATRLMSLSALLDATDPDLSAFRSHGGKLILWHGWADYAISAYGTVRYYEHVVSTAGGQSPADAFVRFYTSPGVDHTGTGKGGPIFDLLGPLDGWVEQGTAPGDLVAYRRGGGALLPVRPLCRYPTYPRYSGAGDPSSAASFSCAAPAP
jgi:tannase/feruloyl esterase